MDCFTKSVRVYLTNLMHFSNYSPTANMDLSYKGETILYLAFEYNFFPVPAKAVLLFDNLTKSA